MKLWLLILKEEDLLDDLVHRFQECDIQHVTVLKSDSVVEESKKKKNNEVRMFGTLRYFLEYEHDESRVIYITTERDDMNEIVRDLVPEHQYILFQIPVLGVWGKFE